MGSETSTDRLCFVSSRVAWQMSQIAAKLLKRLGRNGRGWGGVGEVRCHFLSEEWEGVGL